MKGKIGTPEENAKPQSAERVEKLTDCSNAKLALIALGPGARGCAGAVNQRALGIDSYNTAVELYNLLKEEEQLHEFEEKRGEVE
jgi:hypothetical protein